MKKIILQNEVIAINSWPDKHQHLARSLGQERLTVKAYDEAVTELWDDKNRADAIYNLVLALGKGKARIAKGNMQTGTMDMDFAQKYLKHLRGE